MLFLVIRNRNLKSALIPHRPAKGLGEVADDGLPGVVYPQAGWYATDLSTAVDLQGESHSSAAGTVGGKAVHVQHGQVNPSRRRGGHTAAMRLELVFSLKSQGVDAFAGEKRLEFILHQIQIPASDLHLGQILSPSYDDIGSK